MLTRGKPGAARRAMAGDAWFREMHREKRSMPPEVSEWLETTMAALRSMDTERLEGVLQYLGREHGRGDPDGSPRDRATATLWDAVREELVGRGESQATITRVLGVIDGTSQQQARDAC